MRYSLLQKKCNNMFLHYSSLSDITFAILVFFGYYSSVICFFGYYIASLYICFEFKYCFAVLCSDFLKWCSQCSLRSIQVPE